MPLTSENSSPLRSMWTSAPSCARRVAFRTLDTASTFEASTSPFSFNPIGCDERVITSCLSWYATPLRADRRLSIPLANLIANGYFDSSQG